MLVCLLPAVFLLQQFVRKKIKTKSTPGGDKKKDFNGKSVKMRNRKKGTEILLCQPTASYLSTYSSYNRVAFPFLKGKRCFTTQGTRLPAPIACYEKLHVQFVCRKRLQMVVVETFLTRKLECVIAE